MARLEAVPVPAGVVRVVFTSRDDGDFRIDAPAPELERRRRSLTLEPWTWLNQVHGSDVITVGVAGERAGVEADASLTVTAGCPLAVTTADCAPVVLVAAKGVAVVHAGWRGLVAGVIERAAAELHATGGEPVATLLGPCIGPAAYEFGGAELDRVACALGDSVRATTASGAPALDLVAGVGIACERGGWPAPPVAPPCTSGPQFYSHRTRGDVGRQATVAWLEEGAP